MPVYCNNHRLRFTKEEIHLEFAAETPWHNAEVNAPLVMLPRHFKALFRTFEKQIRAYEEEHGEIPEPEQLVRPGQPDLSGVN